jgi:hypothetical protein
MTTFDIERSPGGSGAGEPSKQGVDHLQAKQLHSSDKTEQSICDIRSLCVLQKQQIWPQIFQIHFDLACTLEGGFPSSDHVAEKPAFKLIC